MSVDVNEYQQLSPGEHILQRPGMYIGSIEEHEELVYVCEGHEIHKQVCKYVPGLYKIMDEILVNAADHSTRDPFMDTIRVEIDPEGLWFSIMNNGRRIIPLEIHPKYNCYVPELVFGRFLTSKNYDDSVERLCGGLNGIGNKATNVMSRKFVVKIIDVEAGLSYTQCWTDNMNVCQTPILKQLTDKQKSSMKNHITVTVYPDFQRFGNMTSLNNTDILKLIRRRVIDLAGILSFHQDLDQGNLKRQKPDEELSHKSRPIKVYLGNERMAIKGFKEYVQLYTFEKVVYRQVNDRWQVAVGVSPDGSFQQVSFVNAIYTLDGGTHVDYVTNQLVNLITAQIKHKSEHIKPMMIRNNLWVFVNCRIINPTFDNQIKTCLKTPQKSFGSTCKIEEEFVKKIISGTDITEKIMEIFNAKLDKELAKNDGKKCKSVAGIAKLQDAQWAGGPKSKECTLIVTEGDSAKALIVAGIAAVGSERYGVYPLKGKCLNPREMSKEDYMKNEELKDLVKIIGLQFDNENLDLRYGQLQAATDQDSDGLHIRGLLFNMFHYFWPSLLKRPNFMAVLSTPIIRIWPGLTSKTAQMDNMKPLEFFHEYEAQAWIKDAEQKQLTYVSKYYKGLGGFTAHDAKRFFKNLNKYQMFMTWESDACGQALVTAFSKREAHTRKEIVAKYDPNDLSYYQSALGQMSYRTFIEKELILYWYANNMRSIPSLMDGLKPGQRKILYVCLLRKQWKEIKVAQLTGAVSEKSGYEHGEASLAATIIGMAQNFVGSNNINLLYPSGQFGTRLKGGNDAAAPRYIFTRLTPIVRTLFSELDDLVLDYLNEDGLLVEPQYYVPIIPLVLVNGCLGIGSGWSTFIPNHNPLDIIEIIDKMLDNAISEEPKPWYRGFSGELTQLSDHNYVCYGRLEQIEKKDANHTWLHITELPVGVWTHDYKKHLETMLESKLISQIIEAHSESQVLFKIRVSNDQLAQVTDIYQHFSLVRTIHKTNMVLYSPERILKKYNSVVEIIQEFYTVRLEMYRKRKVYLLKTLKEETEILENKVKYIEMVRNKQLSLFVCNSELLAQLVKHNFKRKKSELTLESESEVESSDTSSTFSDFSYLVNQRHTSLTLENVVRLQHQCSEKRNQYLQLEKTKPEDLYRSDLKNLKQQLKFIHEPPQTSSKTSYIKPIPFVSQTQKAKRKKSVPHISEHIQE